MKLLHCLKEENSKKKKLDSKYQRFGVKKVLVNEYFYSMYFISRTTYEVKK